MAIVPSASNTHIREVWETNLEAEFSLIREIVDAYPYVAMDTEFPGVVAKLTGDFRDPDLKYTELKENVNQLKLIQVGLTFSDGNGRLPTCGTDKFCVWQFNFCDFNPKEDKSAKTSIDLLRESGIDLERNNSEGVKSSSFAEQLISSGAVLNDSVSWVTFQGGYDFGYLLKALTGLPLPKDRATFLGVVNIFFPVVYDIRHMINRRDALFGGLDIVAQQLQVGRVGMSHQAGSDSLLTSSCFFPLKDRYFRDSLHEYVGSLYRLV